MSYYRNGYLGRFQKDSFDFIRRNIITEETLVYYYTPETKLQTNQNLIARL